MTDPAADLRPATVPGTPPLQRRRGSGYTVPAQRSSTNRPHLTIAEVCDELGVARRTFYDWRAKGRGPRCLKLPNGEIRVRRVDLDAWLTGCEEAR